MEGLEKPYMKKMLDLNGDIYLTILHRLDRIEPYCENEPNIASGDSHFFLPRR